MNEDRTNEMVSKLFGLKVPLLIKKVPIKLIYLFINVQWVQPCFGGKIDNLYSVLEKPDAG
jgi:hypothetical protein